MLFNLIFAIAIRFMLLSASWKMNKAAILSAIAISSWTIFLRREWVDVAVIQVVKSIYQQCWIRSDISNFIVDDQLYLKLAGF